MNRTIFLRNFAIFMLFVLMLFITPFVFASEPHQMTSITISDGYIDGVAKKAGLQFRARDGEGGRILREPLVAGTTFRIPTAVLKLYYSEPQSAGGLKGNLNKILEIWKDALGDDLETPKVIEVDGDNVKIPALRVQGDKAMFPVKVETDNSQRIQAGKVGYINLQALADYPSFMRNYGDKHDNHMEVDRRLRESPFANVKLPDDFFVVEENNDDGQAAGDGTTTEEEPPTIVEEMHFRTSTVGQRNCENRADRDGVQRYKRSGSIYENSCFKGKSNSWMASIIMNDIISINSHREFKLDPRFSVCIAKKESDMHPNAKGADDERGMYQIIPGTLGGALAKINPVTSGFEGITNRWDYIKKMINYTHAQADLHHEVVRAAAKSISQSLLNRVSSGNASLNDWERIANRYNGGASARGETNGANKGYGTRIMKCMREMQKSVTRNGNITNTQTFENALKYAKGILR